MERRQKLQGLSEGRASAAAGHDERRAAAALADQSPRGAVLGELARLAHNGPAAVAQRRRLDGMFGAAAGSGEVVQAAKGKFTRTARSPGADAVTSTFIDSHLGNKANARQTAENRGLPLSHTIDINELGRLLGEMRTRQTGGYYVEENEVDNPNGNPGQYLTGNAYYIWETATNNRGKLKPTRLIQSQFFYDAPAGHGHACHHFDGLL